MKGILLFAVISIIVSSCIFNGNHDEQKDAKPVEFGLFETYTKQEIDSSWFTACNWVSNNDVLRAQKINLKIMVKRDIMDKFMGIVSPEDVPEVNAVLKLPEVKALFPKNLRFMWSRKAEEIPGNVRGYILYALKIPEGGKARINETHIRNASRGLNVQSNANTVNIEMTNVGSRLWMSMSQENIGRNIAIVIDRKVVSAPVVRDVITGGSTEISGNFTTEEAQELADGINAGH